MPVDKFGRMSDTKTKDTGVSLTYINNNYIRSDGGNPVTGSIDMKGNTLYNVSDPVNPQDVVTKVYVDNTKGSGVIGRKIGDAVSIKENLDFLGKQKIKNLPEPVDDNDAVNKKYVDDQINFNSAFSKRKAGGYEARENLYMRRNKILGLKEPLQDGEAANKKYVDDLVTNHFVDENDNITFGRAVDMEGNKIFSLPEPEQDSDPATKKYVDDLQTQYIDKRGNVKFDNNINVGNNRIFNLKDPTKPKEGANKQYVDESITKRIEEEKDNFLPQDPATKQYVDEAVKQLAGGDLLVSKEGVFIKANGHYRATAPLDIDNHKMENLPDPVDEKDAVNKKYIDGIVENLTLKQGLVRENGGFNLVDSYINMNFNRVRNIPYPHHNEDAVPRSFLDGEIKAVKESTTKTMGDMLTRLGKTIDEDLKKRTHIISATASYHGDLTAGEYQFTWGGQSMTSYKKHDVFNGFLVPSSGKIKKFDVLVTGLKIFFHDNNLNDYVNTIGEDNLIRLFTLVLIKKNQTPVDIGTLFFFFKRNNYNHAFNRANKIGVDYVFKYKDPLNVVSVEQKDIINIRTEFNMDAGIKKVSVLEEINYNLGYFEDEFFTYLATVLIELDPLDD